MAYLTPPEINEDAFIIEEANELSAQGDALAANQVTLDRSAIDQSQEFMAGIGQAIGDRIGAKDTVSALQAKKWRNMAQNAKFAPGASLAERLSQSANLNMQAAVAGSDAVREEGLKRTAMQKATQVANMNAELKTREFQNRATAANNETSLAVKQAKQGLQLAQQALRNQYQSLQLTAQNSTDSIALQKRQEDINFAFQMVGMGLQTVSTVTAGVSAQMTANQTAFRADLKAAFDQGGLTQQQFNTMNANGLQGMDAAFYDPRTYNPFK